ncbi:cystinosin [Salarias fasciatus]|uniref:cystinosin n=1 Tax=Salarias fasciatus TaxID=181472 RepID=UPI001176F471|nr:cystinosin [Salarias fasciatus]
MSGTGELLLLLAALLGFSAGRSDVFLSGPEVVTLQEDSDAGVPLRASSALEDPVEIHLNVTFHSRKNWSSIVLLPEQIFFPENGTVVVFNVSAGRVGQVTAFLQSNDTRALRSRVRIRFLVVRSSALSVLGQVIGWIYFLAWSVSFYPQVWTNWTRKSVVGLNFDFLALNLTGFLAYSIFNVGLFWIPSIQEEFLRRNPNGINPVSANDVFFSLHALLLCLIYVLQAAAYERGGQRVSRIAGVLLLIGWAFALVSLSLAVAGKIGWLDYLYDFSYIKLAVTLVKYVPQAVMNHRRRSTEGWSVGNVLLDFTGGTLSIGQMILQSYNNDQWDLVFGDPTKFGLGLFSVLFDVLFIAQHYCLYRRAPPDYQILDTSEDPDGPEDRR